MKKLFNVTTMILFVPLILPPYIAWIISDKKELNIAIIVKTVPDDSYREHNGPTWFLNNQKIVKRHSQDRYEIDDY
ncbi:MAG: hypothetical protein ACK4M9_01525 [Anaerobacillus sp.]|uniref:hypothetical protein n=1 Tax=Anaerobacillus sp. TaxID=1872506 RepID=UPI00391BA567